ncbi:MAG: peptidase U62, partial [candidate division Zixibacteria bacterium]|nr:peptidase U62 [candidate division Zixibacteria bacterium]
MRVHKAIALPLLLVMLVAAANLYGADASPLLSAMKTELDRSFAALQYAEEVPMYYLSYHVTDTDKLDLAASYGALTTDSRSHDRILGIDCRVGDYQLDNTHEIRGEYDFSFGGGSSPRLPLTDDEIAIRTVIWHATDKAYKDAQERYTKVLTNQQVLVEKEDTSADFSQEEPNTYLGEPITVTIDAETWKPRLRQLSAIFKGYPFVERSSLRLSRTNDNRYFVDSDGAMIQTGQCYIRLFISCSGTCEDGMRINRYQSFSTAVPEKLPDDEVIKTHIYRLIEELKVLLAAPLAEPYTGPAILVNRAAGVFFHEIFGHRIEGHRQKSEYEGQTFARKVGKSILPDFISIHDDPTLSEFNGTSLRGHYLYDDEGVKATPVTVVDKGILKNFLMSRSPVEGFPHSNAHGRKQAGRSVVSRQGNLMIKSTNEFPFETLKEMLLEECEK